MSINKRIGVGIIGCGNISQAYFRGAGVFDILQVVSCADINMDAAKVKAEENAVKAQTVEELLANKDIEIVINLTVPSVHAKLSMAVLNSGKHVYSEKPLASKLEDARSVLDLAKEKELLIGCAPDTFLGAGLQTCRKVLDDGWIGRPIGGTAFLMSKGPESWHPNPAFFYLEGAGPMFDMGPYYMTALVHLLGPVKRVSSIVVRGLDERIATCEEKFGKKLTVEVPTHFSGSLEFHSGSVITVAVSFDVHRHGHGGIELYGTDGSLKVPDPNTFGGPVNLFTPAMDDWQTQDLSHGYADNTRGIGVADMAYAILSGRKHRASGELAYHVLEIMHAFEVSSKSRKHILINSKPERPVALPLGLSPGQLDG